MRDNDEVPYIVVERGGGSVGPFILGALIGAGLALLFAPQSGEQTQQEIRERARRLKDAAESRVRTAQRQLEDRLDVARQGLNQRVDAIKDAVDTGRQAARDARSELEKQLERSKAAYRAGVDAAREKARAEGGMGDPDVPEPGQV